jgi:hypothetical protein
MKKLFSKRNSERFRWALLLIVIFCFRKGLGLLFHVAHIYGSFDGEKVHKLLFEGEFSFSSLFRLIFKA